MNRKLLILVVSVKRNMKCFEVEGVLIWLLVLDINVDVIWDEFVLFLVNFIFFVLFFIYGLFGILV